MGGVCGVPWRQRFSEACNHGLSGDKVLSVFREDSPISDLHVPPILRRRRSQTFFPHFPAISADFKMLDKVADMINADLIVGASLLHPTDSRFLVEFVVVGILKWGPPPPPLVFLAYWEQTPMSASMFSAVPGSVSSVPSPHIIA